jgi:DNA-binding LytR/AlgR family response regulator
MPDVFFTRINGKFQSILFKDVLYFAARKNYSEIYTIHKKRICIYISLGLIETTLPNHLFCRIHRSFIIATQKIKSFDRNYVYVGEEKLPISKLYFDELISRVVVIANGHDIKNKE